MKKILIVGSICAVVLLVLASFGPVVGYQTKKQSSNGSSPLFCIRTDRAINGDDAEHIECNFFGKNQNNDLVFPERESKNVLINGIIDKIKKMDDETFTKLCKMVDEKSNDYMIIEALNNIRNSNIQIQTDCPGYDPEVTLNEQCPTYGSKAECLIWVLSLFLIIFIGSIFNAIVLILRSIIEIIPGKHATCYSIYD